MKSGGVDRSALRGPGRVPAYVVGAGVGRWVGGCSRRRVYASLLSDGKWWALTGRSWRLALNCRVEGPDEGGESACYSSTPGDVWAIGCGRIAV